MEATLSPSFISTLQETTPEIVFLTDIIKNVYNKVLDEYNVNRALKSIETIHFTEEEKEKVRILQLLIENEFVDIIGHPTGRIIDQREPYDLDMQSVLEAARRTGTAMEINAYPTRLDLNDINARAAKEMDVKMCINSDAHEPEQLKVMKYGMNVARRAWLEKKDLLNTLHLQELLKVLKS